MFTGQRAASGTDFIWKGVGDGKRRPLVTLYRPRNPGSHGRGFELALATYTLLDDHRGPLSAAYSAVDAIARALGATASAIPTVVRFYSKTAAVWCVPFSGAVGLFNKLQTQKKYQISASSKLETVSLSISPTCGGRGGGVPGAAHTAHGTLVRLRRSVRFHQTWLASTLSSARSFPLPGFPRD